MTLRQIFEAMLVEVNKTGAPSLLLLDYNYLINKAVNQYINKKYNIYDTSQQTTDDLRVLKATAFLDVSPAINAETDRYGALSEISKYSAGSANLFGGTYIVNLPIDYLHMLNCICIYKLKKRHKCYNQNDYVQFPAKRLTADAWSVIVNDYYNRPLPERPYYYIHNVNTHSDYPYNEDTDMSGKYSVGSTGAEGHEGTPERVIDNTSLGGTNFDRVITLSRNNSVESPFVSSIERETAYRYGNNTPVRCEIRYGKDNSVFELEKVLIDYIKTPLTLRLTQELIDLTEDTSQVMEFPDYVCQEIINELVTLVMENSANQRLQTFTAVSNTIANPAQQTQQPLKG